MKHYFFALLGTVLLFTAAEASPEGKPAAPPAPKMELPVLRYDIGPVQWGTVFTREFPVKNHGNAPLRILEAKPNCGCTTAKYKNSVAPGVESKIIAEVNTRVLSYGKTEKTIHVRTDDPAMPEADLVLTFEVTSHIMVLPSLRISMSAPLGAGEVRRMLLHATDGVPFEVVSASSDTPLIEVSYAKADRDGVPVRDNLSAAKGDYVVTLRLLPSAPAGYLMGREISLKTTHPKMPVVTMTLSMRVIAP